MPEQPERMASSKIQFGYRRHTDQDRSDAEPAEHPVVVVGAGPVGLSFAIDMAQRGQAVVLLDDADRIGEGSRAICFSKRSLEYWDRLRIWIDYLQHPILSYPQSYISPQYSSLSIDLYSSAL